MRPISLPCLPNSPNQKQFNPLCARNIVTQSTLQCDDIVSRFNSPAQKNTTEFRNKEICVVENLWKFNFLSWIFILLLFRWFPWNCLKELQEQNAINQNVRFHTISPHSFREFLFAFLLNFSGKKERENWQGI